MIAVQTWRDVASAGQNAVKRGSVPRIVTLRVLVNETGQPVAFTVGKKTISVRDGTSLDAIVAMLANGLGGES